MKVAPARERGLKSRRNEGRQALRRRFRKGAWIEIVVLVGALSASIVAPVRERGLKSY